MEQNFLQFVSEVLNVNADTLSMNSSYKNGDWSSLMHLRLMVEISEEYDVDIPSDRLNSIDTLKDFFQYLEK